MAKGRARNMVIEGEYKRKTVGYTNLRFYIILGLFKTLNLNTENVESYNLVDEQSFGAGAGESALRGLVGGAIAGGAGAMAGVATAPQNDIYVVLIKFKDGKKSLLEIDGEHYNALKRSCMYNLDL